MVFGHLEVLHAKFHDRTISNLGDYVAQTDKQTNKQTDKAIYIVDYITDVTLGYRKMVAILDLTRLGVM